MTGHDNKRVPVQRDARTFEQRRKDMVNRLRNRVDTRSSPQDQVPMEVVPHAMHSPDWFDDVNGWIDETDRTWNGQMQRMHHDMFSLVPTDIFDFPTHDFFVPHGDIPSVVDRMDRQLQAMRRHMDQTMGMNGQSHQGILMPRLHDKPLDYLKNAYEVGENGQVHFKLNFDLRGYTPDDIHVTTSKHGMNVHAKHTTQTDNSSNKREFSRTIYLPPSVDADHFQCHLSEDGILSVEAPVKETAKPSLTFNREQQLSVKPSGNLGSEEKQQQVASTNQQVSIQPIGIVGPTVLENEGVVGVKKLHVEVPIEPGFSANDLCVRMDANRVIVSGKKECREEGPNTKNVYVREFSRSYDVPETVDTFSVRSQLNGDTLLVEAPLLTPSTSH